MVSYNLVFNRYSFKTPALADTRVNSYVLINIKVARRLFYFLSLLIHNLPTLITVRGFNRQSRQAIN
jgi:hypothetical protein